MDIEVRVFDNLDLDEILTEKQVISFETYQDYTESPEWLEKCPKKIKDSVYRNLYVDCVVSGWSVRQLEKFAKEQCNEDISRGTFHALVKLIPKVDKLPEGFKEVALEGLDVKIDGVQDMQDIIALMKMRIAKAWKEEEELLKLEDASGKKAFSRSLTMKNITAELQVLWQMEKDFVNLQINLGMLNTKDNVPMLTGISVEADKAERMIEGMNPEQMRRLSEVWKEVQFGKRGDVKLIENATVVESVREGKDAPSY